MASVCLGDDDDCGVDNGDGADSGNGVFNWDGGDCVGPVDGSDRFSKGSGTVMRTNNAESARVPSRDSLTAPKGAGAEGDI